MVIAQVVHLLESRCKSRRAADIEMVALVSDVVWLPEVSQKIYEVFVAAVATDGFTVQTIMRCISHADSVICALPSNIACRNTIEATTN